MFLDSDFLLSTETARRLYREAAEPCPVIDYHCHISPREIWEDRRFENITRLWLDGDHYKWRLMRAAGVPEEYITGDAGDRDKFIRWAEVLGRAAGNPLYHWSHLELRRCFGYEGLLNGRTAGAVWDLCNDRLRDPGFSARGLIARSRVELICTTDDPADSLEWHEKLAADPGFGTAVLPAWRPDRVMCAESPDWPAYIRRLERVSAVRIDSFAALKRALSARMAFFHDRGCRLSDHGLVRPVCAPASEAEIEEIFSRRMAGAALPEGDAERFRFACLRFMAGEYARRGWVMQLHYGCHRNNSGPMYRRLGADAGFDCADDGTSSAETAALLDALDEANALPRTILYSLNPGDNAAIDTVVGCFQREGAAGYVQHGAAWWFNDHLDGIAEHLKSLAAQGYLAGFVGMLTDSRSFLSYSRHEYFRRVLCRILGEWVEGGLYPDDGDTLLEIVRGICHDNAQSYFRFPEKRI